MATGYTGVLMGDRIVWTGGDKPPDGPVRVEIEAPTGRADWVAALAALDRLAASGAPSLPDDPVAWQREVRRDRPLPGREEP